jgi:hypothetical protein
MAAATVAEKEEPERPPARREPKLPATVSPSGSSCSKQPPLPSRGPPDPAGSPCGSPDGPPPSARLAACPAAGPLSDSPLRVRPRPGPPFRPCGLPDRLAAPCGLPESGTPVPPCGFPVAPSGSFASVASTAWSEAKCIGRSDGGQPDVSAGQRAYLQVRGLNERVTNRSPAGGRRGSCCSGAVRGSRHQLAVDTGQLG